MTEVDDVMELLVGITIGKLIDVSGRETSEVNAVDTVTWLVDSVEVVALIRDGDVRGVPLGDIDAVVLFPQMALLLKRLANVKEIEETPTNTFDVSFCQGEEEAVVRGSTALV